MSDIASHRWTASDGVELAWHEIGEGRPVILLHGLFSDAQMNWIKFGHAEQSPGGFRVIMPDLRAHGAAASRTTRRIIPRVCWPRRRASWSRISGSTISTSAAFRSARGRRSQAVGEGLRPRRAVLGGMGLEGLHTGTRRKPFFVDAIAMFDTASRGDPHWLAIQFMKTMKVDRVAAALLLATFDDAQRDGSPPSPCRRWWCAGPRTTTMARREACRGASQCDLRGGARDRT